MIASLRVTFLALLLGLASPVHAKARPGLESVSVMTVRGHVVIEPDGSVGAVKLDTAIEPPALATAIQELVGSWKFKPIVIGGARQRATTGMQLALAATPADDGQFKVWVDSVDFATTDAAVKVVRADGDVGEISGRSMKPPGYPPELEMRGVQGTVVLAIRVTPDGKAGQVMAVRSFLYEFNRPRGLTAATAVTLERTAISAAKRWTFDVPTGTPDTDHDMTVTTSVVFTLGYDLQAPGQWLRVQRTPKRPIAWLPASGADARLGVAMTGGSVGQPGRGPELLRDVSGALLP
jgi:outer membrane biosynthesis protein TonB